MGGMLISDDLTHHSAVHGLVSQPTKQDPYRYQHGFGNHHATEAFAGALPRNGTNLPQRHPYGLYAEHLNGTSFISSRESVANVWMYRVRPSVAHRSIRPCEVAAEVESCFLPTNPEVDFTPLTHTWGPLQAPDDRDGLSPDEPGTPREKITFFEGLRTLCGHGDPTLKEGLAVHQYAFNTHMTRQALVNNDGSFLFVPQRGTLDLQTELGHLRVPPGSIAVIPPGIRFAVSLASFTARDTSGAVGYVLEIFGAQFQLPELGPLGANALAHVRDFQYPVASFELDFDDQSEDIAGGTTTMAFLDPFNPGVQLPPSAAGNSINSSNKGSSTRMNKDWQILTKLAGKFHTYTQPHTPFDVLAWHGRYAPYKYNLAHFGHLTANTDQLDPTAYCVLTAPSKWPGVSLIDFCVFGEKWCVARDTLRIPYHHRTMATELVGIVRGRYGGSVRRLCEGGLSFEQGFLPHGETGECWRRESERGLEAEVVGRDFLGFMFHVSSHVGLTKYAMERHPDIRMENPNLWDNLRAPFIDKLTEASRALEKMRQANEAAIQAELTALAFEVMAQKRRLSDLSIASSGFGSSAAEEDEYGGA